MKDKAAASTVSGPLAQNAFYRTCLLDMAVFAGVLVVFYAQFLQRLYAPFFLDESSEAFMQFAYYMQALRTHASPYWDTYINLATAQVPQSPLLSPVTLILVATAWVFNVTSMEGLASLFALASYTVQVLTGFSMYLLLRHLSLGRPAAIIGGLGYSYNYFVNFFGIFQGYYRISALLFMPLVFIYFLKLFRRKEDVFFNVALSGFLLGTTFVSNGDIKPAIYFLPILFLIAFYEGYRNHGVIKTTLLLVSVLGLAAAIAAPQIYPTFEALQASSKAHFPYVSQVPLHPENTLLGFSQNPFSMVMGFLFPGSFFQFYNFNPRLGITSFHLWEMRFSFGISLFLIALPGLFYRTRLHFIWYITALGCSLYILGSSTPFASLFGFISEKISIRYPTRASIVLYFILSIYAAYGVEVLTKRSVSDFYFGWSRPFVKYLLALMAIVTSGLIFSLLQYRFDLFKAVTNTESLSLGIAGLLLSALFALPGLGLFIRGTASIVRRAVPVVLLLFALSFSLFLVSGYFVYQKIILSGNPYYQAFKTDFAQVVLAGLPFYNLDEIKLFNELVAVIASAALCLGVVLIGHRYGGTDRHRKTQLLLIAIMAALFLYSNDAGRRLPSSLIRGPETVFQPDRELSLLYADPGLSAYRIHLPQHVRDRLSSDPGFKKCVHNYCCRQYVDRLSFSFGMDHGPYEYDIFKAMLDGQYSHPFWGLYNVKYIVDDFEHLPQRLPQAPGSYKRLSDNIIEMNKVRPIVFFMDKYTVMEKKRFISDIMATGDPSLLDQVYINSPPELPFAMSGKPLFSDINIVEKASGRLKVRVISNKPGFVVFSEIWAPSWHVFVDGAERKLLNAYGILQAVQLDRGEHEVYFEYNVLGSWKMKLALAASFAGLGIVCFSAVSVFYKKQIGKS